MLDAALRARLDLHETALRGARSLFDGSLSVERDEWRRYVAGLDIARRLADLRGIGFIEYVPRTNLAAFLALTRKDESPDFKHWPEGDREDYHIVKFLEPKATNTPAIGYDSCMEPSCRRAAETARDTGLATLTDKIHLIQSGENKTEDGFFFLLPLYQKKAVLDTVEQRRAALLGDHDLHCLRFPLGPQLVERVVEVHADAAAHADDHRLAVHRVHALLEMRHQIGGHQRDAFRIAHQGLQRGPLRLELLLLRQLLAFGDFLKLRVELRQLGGVQAELGNPALVIDRHRGLVGDGALDFVDGDDHGARQRES